MRLVVAEPPPPPPPSLSQMDGLFDHILTSVCQQQNSERLHSERELGMFLLFLCISSASEAGRDIKVSSV